MCCPPTPPSRPPPASTHANDRARASPHQSHPPQSSHQPAGIGFASPGYEFASDKDTRRRTKSVITPDSRRRAPVSNERIFQENSPTPTWVSVKVFGSSPHSDLTVRLFKVCSEFVRTVCAGRWLQRALGLTA